MTDPLIFRAGAGDAETQEAAADAPRTATGEGHTGPGTTFGRVLVATDFSTTAAYALELARARFPGARLRLVHVTDARVTAARDLGGGLVPTTPDPTLLHTLEDLGESRLSELAREGEETELLMGDPVTGILDAAERWEADLIVVGTHSRGAIERFFVGSSAERLVARSPLPVLTVRPPAGSAR